MNKCKVFISLTIIVVLVSLSLYAQTSHSPLKSQSNIRFEHITVKEGLSQNNVTRILKDSKGFMWFGTLNGLNRYDGKSFKVYKYSPDDPNSLSNNHILAIHEDKNGNLWIGTYGGGLNKFERTTERFTHFKLDPENNNSISSNFILSLYENKSGFLWIGTNGSGINKFNMKEESFIRYSNNPEDPNSLSHNVVRAFYEDESGILWIGTDGGGLNKFDKNTKKFTSYKHDQKNPNSLSHDFVLSIIEDGDGALWLATFGGGLNKFNKDTETFSHFRHDPNDLNSLATDVVESLYKSATEPGVIWIATDDGLDKFEIRKEKFTHFKHDIYNSASLISNLTKTIYEDDSGLLWVGTADKGLNKYNKTQENILHYKNDPTNTNSLSANVVLPIYEDKSGILWIGTNGGGINKFDRKKGVFTYYVHQPDNLNSLSNNIVLSIVEEKPGILWISTFDGLNRFDTKNNKFTIYKHDPTNSHSLSHNIIYALYIDKARNLWIGTLGGGLNKLILSEDDKRSPVFLHYKHDPNDPYSISDNFVITIYEDDQGFLWIGTMSGGLNKFDKKEEKFTRYKNDPNNPNSLSNNLVSTIYQNKNGVLWIGTEGGGLNKLVPGDNEESPPTFIHYQEIDGLSNDFVYGILEDNHHNLWLSTKNGLSKFNPDAVDDKGITLPSTFKNYYAYDGFQDNEFTSTSYFKNSKGEMFFGGINGFNAFYPDSLKENLTIPDVVITGFKVFNEDYKLDTSITEINKIVLSYNENFISFEFAVLDYTAPEKNNYAYKMEDVDPDWVHTDASRRFATYTDLDPGEYIFRVKGSNNNGIWNEEGTSVKIIITPPWWATWWAYTLYGIFIVSLFTGITRFYLNRQRLKNQLELEHEHAEKLGEIDQMKSRFFANISHEFRTPLTLIFGPAKDILDKTKELKTKENAGIIKRNASRLYGLVNQLLDLSKLEAGRMTLETSEQNIIPLLKGLVLSFTSYAERKKIPLKLNTSEENLNVFIDKDKVEKIITNLLSNAFKFTPEGGNIDFTVEKLIKEVEIRISDNGIGIPKERIDKIFDRFYQVDGSHTREGEGTGIGLAITKELVELHKGKIKVESEYGKGTTFKVLLPLGKDHLKPEEIIEKVIKEDVKAAVKVTDLVPEDEKRREKTNIELLLETDEKPLLLVVEDNSDVRKYIINHLEDVYKIQEAVDGEDGLNKSVDHIPDLIVSDVMMPKMDGFEFCEKIKTDERTSHIPVILLTAKATSKDKIEGYETGADDYIMKPFDAQELKVRIKNLIDQRKKLREHFLQEGIFNLDNKNITSVDKKFLEKAVKIINEHLSDSLFGVEMFASEIALSRVTLHKKLVVLIGEPPGELIKRIRLCKAAKLIVNKTGNISEIALEVGFNNPAYFSECFKKQFGVTPSQYQHNFTDH